MTRHVSFIGLGSNLGESGDQLAQALIRLNQLPGTTLLAQSGLYRSAPVGYLDQPDFVNAVAKISTTLMPQVLLAALLQIERECGRERTFANAPRTLDLDILMYGHARIASPTLTIPHPRMGVRAFVLIPLAEIAPQWVDTEQLNNVRDQAIERLQ